MDCIGINKGVLQSSIMDTRKARHLTHSKDAAHQTPHLNLRGIWIDGGTDEISGMHIDRISRKQYQAVQSFIREEERDINSKFQRIA